MSYTNETVTNAVEFNAQNVLFAEPKVNPKTQGKSVALLNPNKTGIKLAFPMALNWGAQSYTDPSSNRVSYSLSIQFPGKDYVTPDTDKWLANMIALEESVLNHVLANWKKLFNKPPPSREVADALYTRALKYQKDKETGETLKDKSPTMKIKLGYWDGKFDCELFDTEGKMIYSAETTPDDTPMDYIPKASQAAVIVQCTGIWFAGGKFGVTWKLIQAVIKQKPTLKGKCYIQLPKPEAEAEAGAETEAEETNLRVTGNSQSANNFTVLQDPVEETQVVSETAETPTIVSSAQTTLLASAAAKKVVKRK